MPLANVPRSIVEYATREQAQQAVAQLSNQNLMGRLVYVREVCAHPPPHGSVHPNMLQDREAEPRFIGATAGNRGGFGGGMPGGFNPGYGGGAPGGGGRQIYVTNVSWFGAYTATLPTSRLSNASACRFPLTWAGKT